MTQRPARVIEDLDEAMGELLHLFGTAADLERIDRHGLPIGPMPHQIDGDLFYACWCVVNEQRFEVTNIGIQILFEVYLPAGNANANERARAKAKRRRRK